MESSLSGQALALLCFFAGGLSLGILYDVFRPIRWQYSAAWITDILFCLLGAVLFFLLAMSAGSGTLGVWELMSSLLGFCIYIMTTE